MLISLLNNIHNYKLVLIEDTTKVSLYTPYVLKKLCDLEGNVGRKFVVVVTERKSLKWIRKVERSGQIVTVDCYSNALGWNKNASDRESELSDLVALEKRICDVDGEKTVLFDSLLPLLRQNDAFEVVDFLRRLGRKETIASTVSVLHTDGWSTCKDAKDGEVMSYSLEFYMNAIVWLHPPPDEEEILSSRDLASLLIAESEGAENTKKTILPNFRCVCKSKRLNSKLVASEEYFVLEAGGRLRAVKLPDKNADVEEKPADPTENLTFNLKLKESEKRAREEVELPYEHKGEVETTIQTGSIFVDPEEIFDEEDPDEDLDL